MEEKKYVPNDVFVFRVAFEDYNNITIYTKPFPEPDYGGEEDIYMELERQENLVQSRYFTKERIEQLKEELIKRIRESENPFSISCVDVDGGYNVSEEQLFNLE